MKERLQKILSQAGIASRRKAEELILAGKVIVNGERAKIGDKASFDDEITVNGIPLMGSREEKVYIMLNKPEKTVSTVSDPAGRVTVVDYINIPHKIFPVGRLDYDTTGTLLLTNDGELSHRLTHPSFEVVRVYRARINEALTEDELSFLNSDRVSIDGVSSKQKVTKVDNKTYVIALHVGSYHHIKRLFELVDRSVIKLTRIEFAGLSHAGVLSQGEWKYLKPKEVKWLKHLTGLNQVTSSKKISSFEEFEQNTEDEE